MDNTQYYVMITQSVAIIVALMVAIFSARSAGAAQKATKASFMPIIKLSIDNIDSEKFQIILENIGKEIAHTIRVQIPNANPEFQKFEFALIERGGTEDKWIEYNVNKLKRKPVIRVKYKDIFNSELETIGQFTFREATDGKEVNQVGGLNWQLDLKA